MNPNDLARCLITRNIATMEVRAPGGQLVVTCQSVAALQAGEDVVLTWYNLGPDRQPNPLRLGSMTLPGRLVWRDLCTHVEIGIGKCHVRLLPTRAEYPIVLLPDAGDQGRLIAKTQMSKAALQRMIAATDDPGVRAPLERALAEVSAIVERMEMKR